MRMLRALDRAVRRCRRVLDALVRRLGSLRADHPGRDDAWGRHGHDVTRARSREF
ncbi:MAG: hypothetical protein AAFZ07_26185 [Actinomycetota bacterium]